jgi:hypothetical protein
MRSHQARSLALSVLLILTFFASSSAKAAARDDEPLVRDKGTPGIQRVIRRVSKLIIRTLDTLTLPHP